MRAVIIGKGEVIKGDSKKTGKPYHGQTLYFTYSQKGVEGSATMEQFVDYQGVTDIPIYGIGDIVNLDFDRRGYLNGMEVIIPADSLTLKNAAKPSTETTKETPASAATSKK